MMVRSYAVACLEPGNFISDVHNRSRDFMAEDPGRRDESVLDLLEVCAAYAAGVNAHQYFAVRDFRNRNNLERDIRRSPINGGAHPRRDVDGYVSFAYCSLRFSHSLQIYDIKLLWFASSKFYPEPSPDAIHNENNTPLRAEPVLPAADYNPIRALLFHS
jgi:hypothetical protein